MLIALLSAAAATPITWAEAANLTEAEAAKLGVDAYVYGYPLVTMELTRRVVTNVAERKGAHAPMGQFANLREYPTRRSKT